MDADGILIEDETPLAKTDAVPGDTPRPHSSGKLVCTNYRVLFVRGDTFRDVLSEAIDATKVVRVYGQRKYEGEATVCALVSMALLFGGILGVIATDPSTTDLGYVTLLAGGGFLVAAAILYAQMTTPYETLTLTTSNATFTYATEGTDEFIGFVNAARSGSEVSPDGP